MFSYFLRNEKLNSWIANNDKKAEKKFFQNVYCMSSVRAKTSSFGNKFRRQKIVRFRCTFLVLCADDGFR